MIPENNPLDRPENDSLYRPKVDRGSHKERARVKADASRTLANIDNLLAGGSGRAGVADVDKIFPTTPEDDAAYDSAESSALAFAPKMSEVGPNDVAMRLRRSSWNNANDRERYDNLMHAAEGHFDRGDHDQHVAASEAMDETYRRGVNQTGSQREYHLDADLAGITDPNLRHELTEYSEYGEPERFEPPTEILDNDDLGIGGVSYDTYYTFSPHYSPRHERNIDTAEAQDEWYGGYFPRSRNYGQTARPEPPDNGDIY